MTTFSQQGEIYLAAIAARKRRPVRKSTVAQRRCLINAISPFAGDMDLADIKNGSLKVLAAKLDEQKYSPNSIQSMLTLVKMIIASDVDENGEQRNPRVWDDGFIDAPEVRSEKVIPPTAGEIEAALAKAKSPMREFIATQAATGCRKGELSALRVSDFDAGKGLLRVSRNLSRYEESATKTNAGKREVDIAPEIVSMLVAMLNERTTGRLFPVTLDAVRWAYEKIGIRSHSLRHFRYTLLQKHKIHPAIHNYWIGHSMTGMAKIYGHIEEDLELRQRLVREVGLGFSLPVVAAGKPPSQITLEEVYGTEVGA